MGNKGSRYGKVDTMPERRTHPGSARTRCHEAHAAIITRTRHRSRRNTGSSNIISSSGTERNETRSGRSKPRNPILEAIPNPVFQKTRPSNRSVPDKTQSMQCSRQEAYYNQLVPVSAEINNLHVDQQTKSISSAVAIRIKRSDSRKVGETSTQPKTAIREQPNKISDHTSGFGKCYSIYSREPAEKEEVDVKNGPPQVDSNDCDCCVNRSDVLTKPISGYKQLKENTDSICVNVCTLNQERNIVNVCRNFLINNRNPEYYQKCLHVRPKSNQSRLQLTDKSEKEELSNRHGKKLSKSWSCCGQFDESNRNRWNHLSSHCPCKHLEISITEEQVEKNNNSDCCDLSEYPRLNYQESEQYPDVLQEMSQRHKVQRTMKKFEKLSRNIPVSCESTNSESDVATCMERCCPCRRCGEFEEEVIKANRRTRCHNVPIYHSMTCE